MFYFSEQTWSVLCDVSLSQLTKMIKYLIASFSIHWSFTNMVSRKHGKYFYSKYCSNGLIYIGEYKFPRVMQRRCLFSKWNLLLQILMKPLLVINLLLKSCNNALNCNDIEILLNISWFLYFTIAKYYE